jgi:hypothetical protein
MKRKQKQKKISFEIPADLYRDDLISLLLEYDSFKDYLVDLANVSRWWLGYATGNKIPRIKTILLIITNQHNLAFD